MQGAGYDVDPTLKLRVRHTMAHCEPWHAPSRKERASVGLGRAPMHER